MTDGEKIALVAIAAFVLGTVAGAVIDRLAFERAVVVSRDEQGRVAVVKGTYRPTG